MNRIAIHIGLHKTGTTFLQDELFPKLPKTKIVRGFFTHRNLMEIGDENQIILTDEGISGNLYKCTYLEDFYANVDRIKAIYKNPKIIFGIRQQLSFVPSIYKQYLHAKGYNDIDYLFNTANTGIIKHQELLLMPKINYLLEKFEEVYIYSQESLIQRQGDFFKGLSAFLELPIEQHSIESKKKAHNVGVKSIFQVKVLKSLNKINKSFENIHPRLSLYSRVFRKTGLSPRDICQNKLKSIPSRKFEIDKELKDFLSEYYKNDWTEASKMVSY